MTTQAAPSPVAAPWWHPIVRHWPALAGLTVAVALLVTGAANLAGVAITAPAAAFCFLAAAALGRRWVAWPAILGATAVVVAGRLLGLPWWAGLAIAAGALVIYGLLRGAPRPALDAQALAQVTFIATGILAFSLAPRAGALLAGLALASHAVWDAIHYRRDIVVPRSLAEACMFLDVPLGLGFIAIALS